MWYLPDEFNNHTMRLDGFNTQSCFILSIGQLWGDGGLRDILIVACVYASATVDQMMSGKQYKCAVRGLILIYEALMRCYMRSLFKWYEKDDHMDVFSPQFLQHLIDYQSDICDVNDIQNGAPRLNETIDANAFSVLIHRHN